MEKEFACMRSSPVRRQVMPQSHPTTGTERCLQSVGLSGMVKHPKKDQHTHKMQTSIRDEEAVPWSIPTRKLPSGNYPIKIYLISSFADWNLPSFVCLF